MKTLFKTRVRFKTPEDTFIFIIEGDWSFLQGVVIGSPTVNISLERQLSDLLYCDLGYLKYKHDPQNFDFHFNISCESLF